MAEDLDQLRAAINAKGEAIRDLKVSGANKDALAPHIKELLELKEKYKVANKGVPFDPPAEKKEKKRDEPAQQPQGEEKAGPSKKELKKGARKEARKAGKADAKTGDKAEASKPLVSAHVKTASAAEGVVVARPTIEGDTVFFSPGRPPLVSFAAAKFVESSTPVSFIPHPATQDQHGFLEPQLFLPDNTTLFGDLAIARFLARRAAPQLAGLDAFSASAVDQWLDFVQQYHQVLPDSDIHALLSFLNSHLELRTYIVGYTPTLADAAVYTFLQLNSFTGHLSTLPHLSRWFDLMSSITEIATAWTKVRQIGNAAAKRGGGEKGSAALPEALCPPLEGAVEGKVVTRFPPEPSGYLHIGHAKACLLNDYYAKYYKGKMIVRFDDTNPSKEKDEYEESIKADLVSLGVNFHTVTHTSDHFDKIEQLAIQMIKEGNAYMDNTPQEQMQEERLNRIESKNRTVDVDTNLARFKELLATGTKEYCLRAKIDMSSVNGTMRDPVLYRANPTPHHRTGTRYKAYPTYDFACPIVDSMEGVTHALRTTEYNDRDEQYYWIQKALKLRPVKIQSFARMAFVQTELSKRKLTWFVEQKLVDGWDDPRFPTIQGVMRRGVAVEALRAFILSQGASRRITMMEWDSFWAINKKGYEHSAPRYMAVFADSCVPMTITNGPAQPSGLLIQLHPKRPEMGNRVLRIANRVLIEGQDADTLVEGEEITLTRWGNIKVSKVVREGAVVKSLEALHLPQGDPRKTDKKITWIADVEDTVPVVLTEFDYLISKKRLEEDEDFKDFVNPVTRAESRGVGDPNLRNLKQGEVVQLERRGFFICDRPFMSVDKPCVLFMIPDGRTKAMSTLTGALRHV